MSEYGISLNAWCQRSCLRRRSSDLSLPGHRSCRFLVASRPELTRANPDPPVWSCHIVSRSLVLPVALRSTVSVVQRRRLVARQSIFPVVWLLSTASLAQRSLLGRLLARFASWVIRSAGAPLRVAGWQKESGRKFGVARVARVARCTQNTGCYFA